MSDRVIPLGVDSAGRNKFPHLHNFFLWQAVAMMREVRAMAVERDVNFPGLSLANLAAQFCQDVFNVFHRNIRVYRVREQAVKNFTVVVIHRL